MNLSAEALRDDPDRAEQIAETLKAVAHPLRLRLVAALADGGVRVGRLALLLGVPQAIVSQQLRILRMAGLVRQAKHDGGSLYQLSDPRMQGLLRCVQGCDRP